jgi:hypothetical protein
MHHTIRIERKSIFWEQVQTDLIDPKRYLRYTWQALEARESTQEDEYRRQGRTREMCRDVVQTYQQRVQAVLA